MLAGGVKETVACALPATAAPIVGAPGGVTGTMVPVAPAKFLGELVAVTPFRSIERLPSLGSDA